MELTSIFYLLSAACVTFAQSGVATPASSPAETTVTPTPATDLVTSTRDGTVFVSPQAAAQTQWFRGSSDGLLSQSKCPIGVTCPAKDKWDIETREIYTSTRSTIISTTTTVVKELPRITQIHTQFLVVDEPVAEEGVCASIVEVFLDYPSVITYTHLSTTTDFVRSYTTVTTTLTTKIPYTSSKACKVESTGLPPSLPPSGSGPGPTRRPTGGSSAGPSKPEFTMMGESGTGTLDNSGGGADSTVPTDEAGGATGFDFDSQQEPLFGQA